MNSHPVTETWKPIPGLDGYFASDLGRIKGPMGHPLRPYMKTRDRYPTVDVRGKRWRVHRLILLTFVGPRPDGWVTRHLDGTRTNNRLENLAWGTRVENAQDSIRHGTLSSLRKTHCPAGHAYDMRLKDARRRCGECHRANNKAWYDGRLEEALPVVVKARLRAAGVTLAEAGAHLGMSKATFHRRTSGVTPFSSAELAAVAELLGTTIADLESASTVPSVPLVTRETGGAEASLVAEEAA